MKDILKNLDNDKSSEEGSARRRGRKSKLLATKRRSIAESVMLKNFQKDAQFNKEQEEEKSPSNQQKTEDTLEAKVNHEENQIQVEEKEGSSQGAEEIAEVVSVIEQSEVNNQNEGSICKNGVLKNDDDNEVPMIQETETRRTTMEDENQLKEPGIKNLRVKARVCFKFVLKFFH